MQFKREKTPARSSIQARKMSSKLKFAVGFSAVALSIAVAAVAQNAVLKGKILKELEVKPNASLIDKYGDAANDPAVADALRKAQGQQTTDQLKETSNTYEALQNGTWKPGADPTTALMYGYVPPNMSPEQAQMLYKHLPHLPKMPQRMTPEQMAGEPEGQRAAIEPASPYIPYPESFAKARGIPTSRQLQMIPQQTPGQMAGMPGMPMMGFGPGMGYGLSREEIAAQNQKIAEESIRARFGPVAVPTLQPGHNWLAEQARKNAASQHVAESEHQSVVGVCDNNGNEITSIQYDPWGQPTVLKGTVMPTFMYKGMYYHDRSQNYLTLARVYNPKLGRWLSRDPLGEATGTNLYAYAGNDPINHVDPLGLDYWLLHDTTALGSSASSGIGPFGHTGNLVGNPTTGYDYYSSSHDPNFQIARHFDTLPDVENSGLMNRYSEAAYVPTTPEQDAAMSAYGSQNYQRFNMATNNCSNLSKGMMSAGGLGPFRSGFPSRPNALFNSVSNWAQSHGGAIVNPSTGLMP